MKVLLMNKFLFPNAGAESVFLATRSLLARKGHEVIDFAMKDHRNLSSDYEAFFPRGRDYGAAGSLPRRARDAASSIYSVDARRSLRKLVAAARPDVAHLHNVYHQLSLSVIDELFTAGVPIVLTLHDYKPVCPSYVIYTEGAPCRRCVTGSAAHAVRHRCIKGSRAASLVGAAEATLARRRNTWERVDRFVAPSEFMASMMAEGGVGAGKVQVVPNFLDADSAAADQSARGSHFLYVGRLEEVKGVRQLIDAVSSSKDPTRLRVIGDGPLRGYVEAAAAASERIEFLGRQPAESVGAEMRLAAALVVPSLWEENCPMVVLEARAHALPVVCSDRGGLPELVSHGRDGLIFRAEDPIELLRCLRSIDSEPGSAREMGLSGHERLSQRHSAESHYPQLMSVYTQAAASAASRLRAVPQRA